MLAHLQISSWSGVVAGAHHYYGRLVLADNDFEIDRELDVAATARMNRDERSIGDSGFTWEVGNRSGRFHSEEELIEAALEKCRTEHPEVTILLKGSRSVLDPQPVLMAPEPLKTKLNELVAEAEANDYWEGDEEAMEEIFDEWYRIIKPLREAA